MKNIFATLSPTITRMMRMDHAHVLSLYHKLTPETSPMVRQAVIRNICAALEIHAQLKEDIFYPALISAGITSPILEKSEPEHQEIRQLIQRIRSLESSVADQPSMTSQQANSNSNSADAKNTNAVMNQQILLNELVQVAMHHMADEETQLLPMAEQKISQDQLSELGAKMTRRRFELASPRAGELAKDMAIAAPGKTALLTAGSLVLATLVIQRIRRMSRVY